MSDIHYINIAHDVSIIFHCFGKEEEVDAIHHVFDEAFNTIQIILSKVKPHQRPLRQTCIPKHDRTPASTKWATCIGLLKTPDTEARGQ